MVVLATGVSSLPPRAELPEGIEALIDCIMLIEAMCELPNVCNYVFIVKAAGGVRPIRLLFAIVRVQCKRRRIEAKQWEASNGEGFFLVHARARR